uniref:C-type lectin domain-containing protein n=2 Tax=Ciona intestinalis TaxID=7719 RepID=F7ATB7_CIOIN
MKCIWFLLVVEVMSVVDSHRPLTNGGSFELALFSSKAKTQAEIVYRMCLPKVPDFVHATARPSNPSLSYKFNVTILEIMRGSFLVEIERVDQATGWDTMLITVDWSSYIGNVVVYQNLILWFPDAADRRILNAYTASQYCNDNGGQLVDIVDKAMYDVVYDYCQQTIEFGWARIWLGSSYNQTTDTVTQRNGKLGYHGDWYPGFPGRGSGNQTYTGLLLYIK